MKRFLVEDLQGETAIVTGERLHHLARVLRLSPGDEVEVFDGKGGCRRGRIESVGETEASIGLGEWRKEERAPAITLAQALSRPERFELVLQKATEMGAARFSPLALSRCVVRLDAAKGAERAKRWRRIAEEAARQSERTDVPEVEEPLGLEAFLEGAKSRGEAIGILWEEEKEGLRLGQWVQEHAGEPLALIIGPEGGITREEVEAAKEAGASVLALGPRVLRTETAGIVAVAIAMHRLGALG